MDELATTKPSDDQSLEPESINRVVLQSLKDLESDLRKYANKAEQAVVPVLEGSDKRSSVEFWAKLSGSLHAGIILALCGISSAIETLEKSGVRSVFADLPTSEDPSDPE
jgi:TATA-binding protein-associated factor Taf7